MRQLEQRSVEEELEDSLTIALAGGRAHAEAVGPGGTQPIELAPGNVIVLLVHAAAGAGVVRVVGAEGEVASIAVTAADGPRRYEIEAPAAAYRIEVADASASLHVRAWSEAPGVLLDDRTLAAQAVRALAAGELEELVDRADVHCSTIGRPAAYAVGNPVAIADGQAFLATIRLVEAEPFRSAYLIKRAREPARVNRRAIVRVVDRHGRAVAHVDVDVIAELPVELAVHRLPPGEYRLVLSGLVEKSLRPVPLEGFVAVRMTGEV